MTTPQESPVPVESLRWSEGELLGWRVWRLGRVQRDGSLRLCSVARRTIWPGPVMTADQEPTALRTDRHGLYVLKPTVRARGNAGGEFDRLWAIVWGWVALSGTVVEHENGYRGARAVVRRLRLGARAHLLFQKPGEIEAVRDELERRYQCPVIVRDLERRLAAASERRWYPYLPPVRLPSSRPRTRDPYTESVVGAAGNRIYTRAVRRLDEQIARWRGMGQIVRIAVGPYRGGVRNVRAVIERDGRAVRVFYHTGLDRWRKA